jgi:hypothetical protein
VLLVSTTAHPQHHRTHLRRLRAREAGRAPVRVDLKHLEVLEAVLQDACEPWGGCGVHCDAHMLLLHVWRCRDKARGAARGGWQQRQRRERCVMLLLVCMA